MQDTIQSPEEKIISAAIECVEAYGLEGATIRAIAERAGVNSAAINYYFRSKDNLMSQVIDTALSNAFDWEDFAESKDMDAKNRLISILDSLTGEAQHYHRVTRFLFHETYVKGNYDTVPIHRFQAFFSQLIDDLLARDKRLRRDILEISIVQIFSAVLLPGMLLPGLFSNMKAVDLSDPDNRRAYIERLVEQLL